MHRNTIRARLNLRYKFDLWQGQPLFTGVNVRRACHEDCPNQCPSKNEFCTQVDAMLDATLKQIELAYMDPDKQLTEYQLNQIGTVLLPLYADKFWPMSGNRNDAAIKTTWKQIVATRYPGQFEDMRKHRVEELPGGDDTTPEPLSKLLRDMPIGFTCLDRFDPRYGYSYAEIRGQYHYWRGLIRSLLTGTRDLIGDFAPRRYLHLRDADFLQYMECQAWQMIKIDFEENQKESLKNYISFDADAEIKRETLRIDKTKWERI